MRYHAKARRPGSILPLMVISMVAIVSFVALAVDVGMIMVAKTQAQNAADSAAMAGARTLDGSSTGNTTNASSQAKTAAKANYILAQQIVDDGVKDTVTVKHGYYYYDTASQTFSPRFPDAGGSPPYPDNWNLTQVTVSRTDNTSFASIFGQGQFSVNATAIGAHRPRDVAIVLDYSGSMNNESDLWNNESYLGSVNNSPNNNDSVVPQYGPYSSSSATLVNTSSDTRVGRSNVTQSALGVSALVNDFYQNATGAGAVPAFSPAASTTGTPVSGDNWLKITQNTGATYAQTVNQVVATSNFDLDFEIHGYSVYNVSLSSFGGRWADTSTSPATVRGFNGYTQGPKYWGKTFMIWPPDPRRAGAVSQATIKQWLAELGYTNNDINSSTPNANQKKVQGIFKTVSGVQTTYSWNTGTPWPNDGNALVAYLKTVPRPVNPGNASSSSDLPSSGGTLMTTSDATFQRIMGLHDRVNLTNTLDWRARFFLKPGGSYPSFGGPITDNTSLFDASGNWKDPVDNNGTNFVINYAAILNWIKNTGPNPFPTSRLRAGRILYYDNIPSDVPSASYTYTSNNNTITDPNQRFWKEYIDWTLGFWADPFATTATITSSTRTNSSTKIQGPGNPACSIGPDFAWGTNQIGAAPGARASGLKAYINYADNPMRQRYVGWFGPMTMVQFISDTGKNPGTANDISMMAAKLGIHGALLDTKNNHPNDLVSLIMFNRPPANGDPIDVGQFAQSYYSLSRDYSGMINSLYYPPSSTASQDVRLWDNSGFATPVPRAFSDYTANTATNYGFMLAYNQFSSNDTLRSSAVGGSGRKGAQRLVVLETDGMANIQASAPFTTSVDSVNKVNKSYYDMSDRNNITLSGSSVTSATLDMARKLCAPVVDTPGHPLNSYRPGFASPNKAVKVHCIAFGAIMETTASGTEPDNAISLLQQISSIGGTGFPSSRTDSASPDFYKLITGDQTARKNNLRNAFMKVMDDGIAVTLIK